MISAIRNELQIKLFWLAHQRSAPLAKSNGAPFNAMHVAEQLASVTWGKLCPDQTVERCNVAGIWEDCVERAARQAHVIGEHSFEDGA